jgi:hypothetical protein
MRMNKNLLTIAITFFVVILSSCKKDVQVGGTAVQELAGDWYVRVYNQNGTLASPSYYTIHSYNTAANAATEMWFEDHFYDTKFKVPVSPSTLTFGGTAAIKNSDPEYEVEITLTNGKIIKKGTIGPASKSPTDSIYYEVQYSDDDPANKKYYMGGYKRTGFEDDDH